MTVVIRGARQEDAPRLAELATELGYPASEEELAPRLAASLLAGGVLVAERDGTALGFAHVVLESGLLRSGTALLAALVVAREHRGAGIGRRLVEAACDWARQRGAVHLRLRSQLKREEAHAFYERLGFWRTKVQAVYGRDL